MGVAAAARSVVAVLPLARELCERDRVKAQALAATSGVVSSIFFVGANVVTRPPSATPAMTQTATSVGTRTATVFSASRIFAAKLFTVTVACAEPTSLQAGLKNSGAAVLVGGRVDAAATTWIVRETHNSKTKAPRPTNHPRVLPRRRRDPNRTDGRLARFLVETPELHDESLGHGAAAGGLAGLGRELAVVACGVQTLARNARFALENNTSRRHRKFWLPPVSWPILLQRVLGSLATCAQVFVGSSL